MELYQHAVHAQRATAHFTFELALAMDPKNALFLFTPEGEREWDPTWDPHFLSSAVFTTDGHAQHRVWVVDEYDPASHHIRYGVFLADRTVTRIDVRVRAKDRGSIATVTYDRTALTASADDEVEQFGTHGETMRAEWQQALDAPRLQRSTAPFTPSSRP